MFVTQGKQVTITLRNGARFAGILTGADTKSHDLGATMKWVRQVRTPLGDNSDERVEEGEYVGGGLEKAMIFEPKDLVDIFAERIALGEDETQSQSVHPNGKHDSGNPTISIEANAVWKRCPCREFPD